MKLFFRISFAFFILLMPLSALAQDNAKEKVPASSRAQRKIAKEKWKQQRKDDRDHKKMVKDHHKQIQTKQTRRSMRKEKRKSDKLRSNKREFFLVRWFRFRN
ncbi:MAG: hypothetical protein ACXVPU_16195 [Bacteroidia bacterium]